MSSEHNLTIQSAKRSVLESVVQLRVWRVTKLYFDVAHRLGGTRPEALASNRNTPRKHVWRSNIELMAAVGLR
jgi:hypothetical protein